MTGVKKNITDKEEDTPLNLDSDVDHKEVIKLLK
jgi:hypothetical protein